MKYLSDIRTRPNNNNLPLRTIILYSIPFIYITKLLSFYYIIISPVFEIPLRALSFVANGFMLCLFVYVFFSYIKAQKKLAVLRPFLFMMFLILIKALTLYLQNPFYMSREYLLEVIKPWSTTYIAGYYYQEMMTNLTSMVLVAAIFLLIRNKKELKTVIFMGSIAFLVPILFTLLMHSNLIGQRITFVNDLKFGGSIWNIGMHSFLSFFWLAVMIYKKSNSLRKFWLVALMLGTIVASVAGLSRTFALVFIVSWAYYLKPQRLTIKKLVIFNLLLISIIIIFSTNNIISNELFERFSEFKASSDKAISNVRFDIWKTYCSYFKETWFFGIPVNLHPTIRGEAQGFPPHSIFFNWFIAYGILGLSCFIFMIKKIYLSIKKMAVVNTTDFDVIALFCWLLSYLLVACFNDTGYREPSLYIAMGIILAFAKLNSSNLNSENKSVNNANNLFEKKILFVSEEVNQCGQKQH